MRLVTFAVGGTSRVGAVVGDDVVDLTAGLSGGRADMIGLLELGERGLEKARSIAADPQSLRVPLASATLLAPVPHPPKLLMGGRNYVRHVEEMRAKNPAAFAKVPIPRNPRIFAKYHVAVNRPGGDVQRPSWITTDIDFEGELSVVIGKSGRNIAAENAYDHIAGYTIVNDVTARDLQAEDELTLAKSFEGFAPMGPWIVTKDEIADPHALKVRTYLGDRFLMENSTSEMLHRIPAFVSFLSRAFPLEVGDVITTGSPPGPGKFLDPPALPQPGDLMRIEIEQIGWLENRLVA
jgi:2-keto-4-pentenoate hydratase/2-oxohepta-3-ene-1,7-dioic acid hydratase in catechol pathway